MNKDNLDLILEFRSLREKRLVKEMMMIRNRMNLKKDELHLAKNKKEWLLFSLRDAQKDLMDIYRVELISHHISRLDEEIKRLNEEIKQINKEYEQKLDQLLEATKQRKLVEKLRQNWIKEQEYKFLREEQKFLDEISNNRFAYKNA